MASKKIIFIFAILWLSGCSKSDTGDKQVDIRKSEKRVVGYLPFYKFPYSTQIAYCKLTHLNLAFANPDAQGNLIIPENIDGVINDARSANPDIIISISLAGAVLSPEQENNWSYFIDDTTNIPILVDKIVDFVLYHDLNGVDVDLEWDHVTMGYSNFVVSLDSALEQNSLLFTAALPNNTRYSNITNEALNAFDFINIMAYDATGSWNPNNPGQHSSYDFAKNGLEFWNKTQSIELSKLTLGVPFYGYDFSDTEVTVVTYGQLVSADKILADEDSSGQIYFNGRPTIEKKVKLTAQDVGGIMIWELGQDSFDEYSLLTTIHNTFSEMGIKTTGLCGN